MANTVIPEPTENPGATDDLTNTKRQAQWAAAFTAIITTIIISAIWLFVFVFVSLGSIGGSGPEYAWIIYTVSALTGLVIVVAITVRAYKIALSRKRPNELLK